MPRLVKSPATGNDRSCRVQGEEAECNLEGARVAMRRGIHCFPEREEGVFSAGLRYHLELQHPVRCIRFAGERTTRVHLLDNGIVPSSLAVRRRSRVRVLDASFPWCGVWHNQLRAGCQRADAGGISCGLCGVEGSSTKYVLGATPCLGTQARRHALRRMRVRQYGRVVLRLR